MVVVLLLMVLAFIGFAGWLALAWAVYHEKKLAAHETSADETMSALFTGALQVAYKSPDTSGGISTPTLVRGAADHGYRLVSESGRMAARVVVFERAHN